MELHAHHCLDQTLANHIDGDPCGKEHLAEGVESGRREQRGTHAVAPRAEETAYHLAPLGDEGAVAPPALGVADLAVVREARVLGVLDSLDSRHDLPETGCGAERGSVRDSRSGPRPCQDPLLSHWAACSAMWQRALEEPRGCATDRVVLAQVVKSPCVCAWHTGCTDRLRHPTRKRRRP